MASGLQGTRILIVSLLQKKNPEIYEQICSKINMKLRKLMYHEQRNYLLIQKR